ncbi:MAG: V-type proton ATPase subunit E, partial [Dictyoglomus sp.]
MTKNEDKLDINYFYNKYKLKIKDEKIDGVGGFIINKENIVIDLTLDNLVNELVNENILEIAQILRGEK